jgi:lipopolysaccharide assembly outer membrane protein LptD (OstA)
MVHCLLLFPQEEKRSSDSLMVRGDSVQTDTVLIKGKISRDAVDKTISHNARGYRKTDLENKKVYLVDEGVVTYGDITLKADSIVLNMETGIVFAVGRRDSTGKIAGAPNFRQGEETFDAKELTYNFKTGKARVLNMVTQQEEGYLHSGVTKKLDDGSFNISGSTYSTCDADPPHFYVGFKKAKVVPGKKIITGPAYLVLEDIPLPIVIPFGFFPIQKKTAESGIIIPKPGQTFQLGYSLRDGGYYFAINDNIDLALTGNIYTNGTWMVNATSAYIKRYKYSGRISLSYARNITGHKGLPDYSKSSNYRIDWSYNQDAKASPGSRFAASVSMSSSAFDRRNSYNPVEHVTAQRLSSISYSKSWAGTPFNFTSSLNHSQDVRMKTVNLNLPQATFTMSRIYPLKPKTLAGPAKWYQELQFQYSAYMDNRISTYDSLLFTRSVFKNMRSGFKHEAPLSIQLRPFKKIPGFTISPQIAYTGVLYTRKFERRWIPDYFDPRVNKTVPSVITDTLSGFFYGQSVNASISAGLSPQIFGTFQFTKPGARLQAIRHIIRPTIGFSYVPVIKGLISDMYRQVQVDTLGRTTQYSVFDGNIYGTPSLARRSGSVTFSLVNILEAKVMEKNDTTGKPKKVKIIDNMSMNTSYNIFADSLRWAPLTVGYRTTLFGSLNFAAGSAFSFYGLDSNRIVNTSYYKQTGKLVRLTDAQLSFDVDLGQLLQRKKKKEPAASTRTGTGTRTGTAAPGVMEGDVMSEGQAGRTEEGRSLTSGGMSFDKYGYAVFDMPWTLRLAYSISYTKPLVTSSVMQTLSMNGTVQVTRKTSVSYTTGFDIARKEITMTSIGIQRDLHCWEMSFDWIPTGYMKSWSFTIRVKASVLADLKYERRKDFHDEY